MHLLHAIGSSQVTTVFLGLWIPIAVRLHWVYQDWIKENIK